MRIKKSKYTRIVFMQSGKWFVHNISSGSECILDDVEVNLLSECDNYDYDTLPELLAELLDLGVVVLAETDENACLELERKISLYSFATNEVGFVIAPTMDCNAKCFYCYENDTRQTCYMNEITQQELVSYIKKTAKGKKKLFISWFGGEPLLCIELIRSVSQELILFCEKNGIEYNGELTTNGYYLDRIIEELNQYNIRDTQITLDGYREEYLKRKHYNKSNDAWEKVIDNIFVASNNGNYITIRFNIDKTNIDSVKQCVRYLVSDLRWNKKISLYFYPLEPCCLHSQDSCVLFFDKSEYELIMTEMYDFLYQCGYYKDRVYALDFHKLSLPCYGATMGILAVDYEGNLYQCQHLLCKQQYAIGNVFSGIHITRKLLQWYDGKIPQQCEKCEVLPLCQGGCVMKQRIGQNDYICHMMKYRLKIQESLKVRHYLEINENI